jgi:thiol-disulfide isomerase/thioredoxin
MIVGIGKSPSARCVKVTWPSGKVQQLTDVPAGTLLTAFENPAESPDGSGFRAERYLRPGMRLATPPSQQPRRLELLVADPVSAGLLLFTTMATWCQACRDELPQLQRLRAAFDARELRLYAVPIEPEDDRAKLDGWMRQLQPPYALLPRLDEAQHAKVNELILAELKQDAVPATFVTDAAGRILHAQFGPPSVSKIRELLAARIVAAK